MKKRASKAKPKNSPKVKVVKETPRFLGPNGRYVTDTHYALGATSGHPTPPEYWVAGEEIRDVPEPQCVSKEDLDRMADEARARFHVLRGQEQAKDEWRSLMGRLREIGNTQLRNGLDVGSLFRDVEKLLAAHEPKKQRRAA